MSAPTMKAQALKPCPFCGAPGFLMLAAFGFKIKCTDTDCTVETPIRTHNYQVIELWNRRAAAEGPGDAPAQVTPRERFEQVLLRSGTPKSALYRTPAGEYEDADVAGRWRVYSVFAPAASVSAPSVVQAEPKPEKMAPVQGYQRGIPWSLHLDAYDAYCKKYGPQPALIDLEGRGCRGGFGTGELDMFIPGWRDKVSELGNLKAEVASLRAALAASAPSVVQAEPLCGRCGHMELCEAMGCKAAAAPPAPAVAPMRLVSITQSQIERHTLAAGDCPPASKVLLVSSVKRLLARGDEFFEPLAAPAVAEPPAPLSDAQDAMRYRWLRSRPLDDDEIFIAVSNQSSRWGLGGDDPDGCDAAIDAAMAEGAGEAK